jgi:hypothetical protein
MLSALSIFTCLTNRIYSTTLKTLLKEFSRAHSKNPFLIKINFMVEFIDSPGGLSSLPSHPMEQAGNRRKF